MKETKATSIMTVCYETESSHLGIGPEAVVFYETLIGKELESPRKELLLDQEGTVSLMTPGIEIPGRGKVVIDLTVVDSRVSASEIGKDSLDAYIFHTGVCKGSAEKVSEYADLIKKEEGIPVVDSFCPSVFDAFFASEKSSQELLQKLAGKDKR
jgi:hypothetical protein